MKPELLRLERADFQAFLNSITNLEYRLLGPVCRDAAIVYDDIRRVEDLPIGWGDDQEAGHYRLRQRSDALLFGFAVGPHSWKKYLFQPRELLWRAERDANGFHFVETPAAEVPLAFLGVRPCELAAIAVQDRVFMPIDAHYRARREKLLLITVQCTTPARTCFCTSMHTGPRAAQGFDLALTEVLIENEHYFVVEIGTPRGAEVLKSVPTKPAESAQRERAQALTEHAARQITRKMPAADVKDLLTRNYESPQWNDVAKRCLTCANCTLACPTCFCNTVSDTTDLTGNHAERWRMWDSCFNLDFAHVHGGNSRPSPAARYRHWITHKLSTWYDQFGTSGCVGCGRCITWCPAGIDITAEVRALQEKEQAHGKH